MYLSKVAIYFLKHLMWVVVFTLSELFLPSLHANDLAAILRKGGYDVNESEAGLVEIGIPWTGQKIYKQISDVGIITESSDVPKFVIDVRTIDYEYYSDRYTFWQDVHLWHPHGLIVADTDQDEMPEILGWRTYTHKTVPEGDTLWFDVLYELSHDSGFVEVHKYPNSTSIPWWSGDLDRDGNMEVLVKKNVLYEQYNAYGQILQSYESPSPSDFATEHNFDVPLTRLTQPNDVTILDLDKDGELDMLYYLDGGIANVETCPSATHIAEYDKTTNSFVEKFCFMQPAFFTSGYAVADLDLDGQLEFATGGLAGELYIWEAAGDDTYDLILEDTLNTLNMYKSTITNDMNWNGKPELWIGGSRTKGGSESLTKIFCIEASDDNAYEIIFEIEMPDVFSFAYEGMAATDINQDGIDEILIWVEGYMFILEGTGSMPTKILYAKKNMFAHDPPYTAFYSATSEDLDGDGYPELLVSMSEGENSAYNHKRFTRIFRPAGPLLSINQIERPETFNLINAFPNPFNASVHFTWAGLSSSIEQIDIYSISGHLVESVQLNVDNDTRYGSFTWDAKTTSGKEVHSGVYLAKFSGTGVNHVIKLTLLK